MQDIARWTIPQYAYLSYLNLDQIDKVTQVHIILEGFNKKGGA